MEINNIEITLRGRVIRMARMPNQWYEDVGDPESLIKGIRKAKVEADIFTFFQRIPETKPKYNYYMEWEPVAALPIISFDHWWKNQIKKNTRQAIKRSQKMGVEVKVVEYNDEFVGGIKGIYDESPIRQGKPFPHYRKDLDALRKAYATFFDRSLYVGAYWNDEMIGFTKLVDEKNFMDIMQIISKMEHRDKAPVNALLAKAVEICAERKILYLEYGTWRRGGLDDFKRHNGFERIDVPRYYIPLTLKGRVALKLHLHYGIAGILPESLIRSLIDLRRKWYIWKYGRSPNMIEKASGE
jgi:hypothetical protein